MVVNKVLLSFGIDLKSNPVIQEAPVSLIVARFESVKNSYALCKCL
jgi:hypothetical protein